MSWAQHRQTQNMTGLIHCQLVMNPAQIGLTILVATSQSVIKATAKFISTPRVNIVRDSESV